MKKHFTNILLGLALVMGLWLGMSMTAYAETEYVEVSTFEELTTAVSKGNNIKLTKDIEVTSEITNRLPVVIDGNGNKLIGNGNSRAFCSKSNLILKNVTISGFKGSNGGAIDAAAHIIVDNCKILNNIATCNGGAIQSIGPLFCINTIFSGNKCDSLGGAIYNEKSIYLLDCTFDRNHTTSTNEIDGGAICNNNDKYSIDILNCSFSGNYYDIPSKKSDLGLHMIPKCSIGGCDGITISPSDSGLRIWKYGTGGVDYSDIHHVHANVVCADFKKYSLMINGADKSVIGNIETGKGIGIYYDSHGRANIVGAIIAGNSIEPITFTAKRGCSFEEFNSITKSGITVTRVSDKVVTVSGTPTDSVIITVPDAVAEYSQTVTFKVVNGLFDDGDWKKTVTLTGCEGDTLKLTADQIPVAGGKPYDGYKAGSWDVIPSIETPITGAITYTYTYAKMEAAVVTKAPAAKTLIYTGSEQMLVTAGEATGGEVQYAIGNDEITAPTAGWSKSIPTGTNMGTYYVWYRVVGDDNNTNTEAKCIKVQISQKEAEKQTETEKQIETEKKTEKYDSVSSGGGGSLIQITDPTPSENEPQEDDSASAPIEPAPSTTIQDAFTGVSETIEASTDGTAVVTSVSGTDGKTLRVTGTVNLNGTNYTVSSFATKSFSSVESKNIIIDLKASGNTQTVTFMPRTFKGSGANRLTLRLSSSTQVKFSTGALSGSKIKKIVVSGLNKKEFKKVQKKLVKSGYKGKIVKK